ncbi:Aldo/keto reductase [Penicillium capsulatum]|uniref:Aldo/keto reductase n=1 Tax=Penicillium capsulatum TaxID=69766 RepID=A0A9W9HSI6_9EURO|nr:Aldo/keto reductase [Penicillium capsulatum]KAJ6105583.1 Aldo/keto reductase [Penicillium capsulatum]
MKYVQLGSSGLRIARVDVGCMSYGPPGAQIDWSLPEEAALPVLNHCYNSGLNFFDTANAYSYGGSEEILGKSIKKYDWQRESIVVATKLFFPVGRNGDKPVRWTAHERNNGGYLNQWGLSRKNIFDSVDASLRRLDVSYIDLLQIHRFDPGIPVRESMEALHDVVKSGKVRYIGASSMRTHQFLEMQYTARMRGWTEFISMQNLYTPTYREEEREMIPACLKLGVGGLPWSPLMAGFLARPWRQHKDTARAQTEGKAFMGHPFTEADQEINEKIEEIAIQRDVGMATVTIAWCLSKPFVVAPILGLSSTSRVDEAISAMDFELSEEETRSIEVCYEPRAIIGHE